MDCQLNANGLTGIAEEVVKHISEGNLDAAVLILGTQGGTVSR